MKRTIIFVAMLMLAATSLQAQQIFLGKGNKHTIFGGEEGKNYAAIFATNCASRKEAMEKTIVFLSTYDLVEDKESVLSSVMEYDDTQSEFQIPIGFRFGWHGTAPVAGAVATLPPVILKGDLLFQFYDEGKMRVIIKNLEDFAFDHYLGKTKSKYSSVEIQDYLTEAEYEEYLAYSLTPTMTDGLGKALTAILVWGNAGVDRISSFFEDMDKIYRDIDKQIKIAQKLADAGYYCFGNGEELARLYRELQAQDDYRMHPMQLDTFEKEIAEGKLVFVSDIFWRRDVKQQFDYFFAAVGQFFDGNIEAVAEDGEITWQMEDGKLLPVDAKLKKKLQKAGEDYFSYYSM